MKMYHLANLLLSREPLFSTIFYKQNCQVTRLVGLNDILELGSKRKKTTLKCSNSVAELPRAFVCDFCCVFVRFSAFCVFSGSDWTNVCCLEKAMNAAVKIYQIWRIRIKNMTAGVGVIIMTIFSDFSPILGGGELAFFLKINVMTIFAFMY
jgi:hypothetical protein